MIFSSQSQFISLLYKLIDPIFFLEKLWPIYLTIILSSIHVFAFFSSKFDWMYVWLVRSMFKDIKKWKILVRKWFLGTLHNYYIWYSNDWSFSGKISKKLSKKWRFFCAIFSLHEATWEEQKYLNVSDRL